ncbi:MAG: DUF1499 domain-containing protein [Desulfuromusa sp.]|jgi:uncharacterized protein (DUF1499 family)|nr:DUF1499 domain-containing protein [Desulfuromusa sp.]
MSISRIFTIGTVLLLASMPLISCSGKTPSNLGVSDSELAPCPASPNCLSSDAHDSGHKTSPFQIDGDPGEAWAAAREIVAELPRTRIVNETPEYLHAECRSSVFGFVDDLELHLRPAEGIIAVRSASRLGYSDFGVNQRRIETLRTTLISRGVVR